MNVTRTDRDGDRDDDRYAYCRLEVHLTVAGGPTDNDVESQAEALAGAIDAAIAQAGLASEFEINGLEFGAGESTILVFGGADDAGVARIHEVVRPVFRAFAAPPGSHLVLVYGTEPKRREVVDRRGS